MSDPYIGEIRLFGGNFAPVGWLFCEGQTLSISEFETLFQLIGTTYGGDGQETFALPDLRGRAPVHRGQAPGGSLTVELGQQAGVEQVTLTVSEMPQHRHSPGGSSDAAVSPNPAGRIWGTTATPVYAPWSSDHQVPMDASAVQAVGGNQPHENRSPYLGVSHIIATQGIFPSSS